MYRTAEDSAPPLARYTLYVVIVQIDCYCPIRTLPKSGPSLIEKTS